jgi:hypothetical protein
MKLLIDGDGFIYRCGFAVEKTKYLVSYVDAVGEHNANVFVAENHKEAMKYTEQWPGIEPNVWSRKVLEPLEHALALVKGALEALPQHEEQEIWLTPPVGNFRDRIATIAKYKGNRDAARRPHYYREITDYLIERHGARYTEGQEADDALGIGLTNCGDAGCIVSFDKDLDQIAGRHYNWVTREGYSISKRDADFNFYAQILSGDVVDNVKGLEGIGPAKARKLLEGSKNSAELWQRVLKAYNDTHGPRGMVYALENARLVYVRRQREETWTPPTEAATEARAA